MDTSAGRYSIGESDPTLLEVTCQFRKRDVDGIIPKGKVIQWMNSYNLEVLGAVHVLIFKEIYFRRIEPRLAFEDYANFIKRYYEICFNIDPHGEWTLTRYGAARALVGWMASIWRDEQTPRNAFKTIKSWLRDLYKNGDDKIRECLITGLFEHIFEHKQIAAFFKDWERDSTLGPAYTEAMNAAKYFKRHSHKKTT